MAEHVRVDEFLSSLLALCRPLEPFDMALLDAHGATLAADVFAGERLVLKEGSRIRSTQIDWPHLSVAITYSRAHIHA